MLHEKGHHGLCASKAPKTTDVQELFFPQRALNTQPSSSSELWPNVQYHQIFVDYDRLQISAELLRIRASNIFKNTAQRVF